MSDYKKELRRSLSEKRKSIPENVKLVYNEKIFQNLLTLKPFIESETVLCYYSVKDEVSTLKLIDYVLEKTDKRLALPKVHDNGKMEFYCVDNTSQLDVGYKGISEPTGNEEMFSGEDAVCITPGLGFDRNGNRIGYGGGYYDRYLEKKKIIKVGLAFTEQMSDRLEISSFDIRMDFVITDKEIIRCV